MSVIRQAVFVAAIPLNAIAVLWVTAGVNLWPPVDSSSANLLKFVVAPILLVAMTATTVLTFLQRRRPSRISAAQAWLQIALWIALFVFGLTFPALAEDRGGASILLRVIGQGSLTSALSGLLWTASFFAAWGVGVALLALLIIGIDSRRQRTSPPPAPTAHQLSSGR